MVTFRQLTSSYPRISKRRISKVPRLDSCPQKRGTVIKVTETTPKKPNSAKRKIAKVKLSSGKLITCHLPGIGHTLQAHSVVLIRGGRCQDLIGVRYKPIRGLFDFAPVKNRISRKSKYGIKGKPEKQQ